MPNLIGTKWGAPALGSPGGVVTWSFVSAGVSGVRSAFDTDRSDITSEAGALADYNVRAVVRRSFEAWSDVANIDFVEVRDGGERIGEGFSASIRVAFGEIDGRFGDTLGVAFFPQRFESDFAGDALFDVEETRFFSNPSKFLAVATHEIGHAIGLDHVRNPMALMNPAITDVSRPRADDIEGVRRIYGDQDGRLATLRLNADRPDIEIAAAYDGLSVRGTGGANEIIGAAGGERLIGRGGDDFIAARGGADTLTGGGDDDRILGGFGADRVIGGAGADTVKGGAGADAMFGGAGDDVLKGGGGGDRISGGGGRDRIEAAAGADALFGGAGRDSLDGGAGRDELTGGGGADRFVMVEGGGVDTILDFNPGGDFIDYSRHAAVAGVEDLEVFDVAAGAAILDGAGGRVVLAGLTEADLDISDFLF